MWDEYSESELAILKEEAYYDHYVDEEIEEECCGRCMNCLGFHPSDFF